MTKENAPESFGRFLKFVRMEEGIDLSVISGRTHVSRDALILLEREDHEKLPPPIYVKGFIRAYADALGIDAADVLRRYDESLRMKNAQIKEADHLKSRFGFRSRVFIAMGTMAVVIFISIATLRLLGNVPVRVEPTPLPEETVLSVGGAAPDSEAPAANTITLAEPESDKLVLRVVAVEPTWFKAIIDGRAPLEFKLKPQDQLEFEAHSHFNLLVGNAAGVKLSLNDKPVNINGRSGEMVTLRLP